jgi:transposase
VQELLSRKFDLQVSVWTVGRYLRAWGLTPQKPVRRAYEQNPAAVRKWLEEEYPAIRELARQWKAQIHWLEHFH